MVTQRTRRPAPVLSRIIGIDPSLNSTGVCYGEPSGAEVMRLCTKFKGLQRLVHQLNQLVNVLNYARPTVAMYEGYAMGSPKRQFGKFDSAELGGQYKVELYKRGIPVIIVPPKTLKLVFAGNGNAGKPEMRTAALELFEVGEGLNDDEIDAFALHAFGYALLHDIGPPELVKRAKAARTKVELIHGQGTNQVQSIALRLL